MTRDSQRDREHTPVPQVREPYTRDGFLVKGTREPGFWKEVRWTHERVTAKETTSDRQGHRTQERLVKQ